VNIALVNELSILCDRMQIDVWEVIDAAATKPYGFMRFDPGPGMGGHCLPVDPFYLTWKAREYDLATEFIELAGKVNAQMPMHCVARIERALNDDCKPVNGSKILLLGMSYKAGVGDVRESPAITIAEQLLKLRAQLSYHDPYVAEVPELRMSSVELGTAVEQADLVVILTAHPEVDHHAVERAASRVLDFRGVLRRRVAQHAGR
jgi:UDP-N-acetyl-D-glucosamine dehydrogenase